MGLTQRACEVLHMVSDLAKMQDWLELGAEARMNAPGALSTANWSWRLTELPGEELAAEILEMTKRYARTGEPVHA